ncbi:hypothetical protein Dda_6148 [Drechslerella dactyloides]|uniref:Uncharacterized protein n=1 Tax=Drechslerella dactyloides TaxID=74499 RepID=A0AAD6IWJ1_DREDA|nr:hypothetical protein Dda_6148 [Drechslerella dactyloides]
MPVSQGTISKFLMVGTVWLLLATLWLMYLWPFPADAKPVKNYLSYLGNINTLALTATSTRIPGAGRPDTKTSRRHLTITATATKTANAMPWSTSRLKIKQRTSAIDFAKEQPGGGHIVVATMPGPSQLEIFNAAGRKMFQGNPKLGLLASPTATRNRKQKTISAGPRVSTVSLQREKSRVAVPAPAVMVPVAEQFEDEDEEKYEEDEEWED